MSIEGFDYAWGYTPKVPAAIVKAGGKFVIRYVGTSSKCLTVGERKALHTAGLAIGLVYETTGVTFRSGHAAGLVDGARAKAAAEAVGAPAGTPIFFAIDTDTRDITTVKDYLNGCAAACGEYRARLYAGFYVIREMASVDHWQTYAWSAGHVSAHAGVYQYHNGVTVGGVDMDKCRLLTNGCVLTNGWLTLPATTPAPAPAPAPEPPASIVFEGWNYTRQGPVGTPAAATQSSAVAPAEATPVAAVPTITNDTIAHGG